MTTKQPISNNIRFHRKKAGLRQLDVARFLGLGSTDRISRWEHGTAEPNIKNLFRLLLLYRATPEELYPEMWRAISGRNVASTAEVASDARIQVEG